MSKEVLEYCPTSECLAKTGRKPISIRWVEVNKGDDESPNVRSRLVAREIRTAGMDAIFAPTPPLESLRMVLSYAVTQFEGLGEKCWDGASEDRMQVMLIDISRAYFNAKIGPADDPVYVELPAGLGAPSGMCGKLRRHTYGARRAADGWKEEYSSMLKSLGLRARIGITMGFQAYPERNCIERPWRRFHLRRPKTIIRLARVQYAQGV